MGFRIESLGRDRFRIVGDLTFETVPDACNGDFGLFKGAGEVLEIDLGGVSHTDSAGIALLIDWMRRASKHKKVLCFLNIPAQLVAIARVSGLDQILPLSREGDEGQSQKRERKLAEP